MNNKFIFKNFYLLASVFLLILSLTIPISSAGVSNANQPYEPAREKYRPVIGGVKIEAKLGLFTSKICTSSFMARTFGENIEGIITAGHCSDYTSEISIRQPSWFWNIIGEIYDVGRASDSEFVQTTSEVANYILHIKYYDTNDTYVGYEYLINDYYSFYYIVKNWDI